MAAQSQSRVYRSGELEIDITQRELRKHGIAIPIGSRAFQIIEALVESTGELVTKDDLMTRVWPGTIVEDHTLQVHMSAIRKALGVDRGIVRTTHGRGYRLLGRWTVQQIRTLLEPHDTVPIEMIADQSSNLPIAVSDLIGRATVLRQLCDLLSAYRAVTLTGPGGIGKTVLALEVARRLLPAFGGCGWVVDFVPLSDASLVPSAAADILGLKLGGKEISSHAVARAIRGKKLLLLLDNCEHVTDAVADLAETLLRACPQLSILTTSREILRIEGEHVYRVPSLDVPPQHWEDSDDVVGYSAVQLFIARISALHSSFSVQDAVVLEIATICRRLDGIPLAIELAAARAAAIGVRQVASRLDDRFRLLTSGRRRALPRHRTLRETLDWSYELLPEWERLLLRRLAIFVAGFTLEEATAIMSDDEQDASAVLDGLVHLVEKSLVALAGSAVSDRWQLLETTRTYALERLAESGEAEQISRRHAELYCGFLEKPGTEWGATSTTKSFVKFGENLGNVRAALEWSFSEKGDLSVGTTLAAASAHFFLMRSLLTECYRWTSRAITALNRVTIGSRREMELQVALGVSLMFTQGSTEAVASAFARGAELAETVDDRDCRRRFLSGLYLYLTRTREFRSALDVGERMKAVGVAADDSNTVAVADWMIGIAYHCIGDQVAAYRHCESAMTQRPTSPWDNIISFGGHDYRISALIVTARALWLGGNPDQAAAVAIYSTQEAQCLEHPLLLCTATLYAAHLFLWMGDWPSAADMIEKSTALAIRNSFSPFHAHTLFLGGALLIKRGDPEAGIRAIRGIFDTLTGDRYTVMNPVFFSALAEGLAKIGQFDQALITIDRAIALVGGTGESFDFPEMLRIKGEIIWKSMRSDPSNAEKCLLQSLDCARKQSALGWELRTAMSLARLWSQAGRAKDAVALLAPLYARYTEGLESGDLKAARTLLNELGGDAALSSATTQ